MRRTYLTSLGLVSVVGTCLTAAHAQSCFQWNPVSTVGGPAPREKASVAFDTARGVMVMHSGAVSIHQFETWEFDGALWTQRSDGPPATGGNGMVYDPLRGKVVLVPNDGTVWEYDAGAWVQVTALASPGTIFRMVFDEARGKVLMVGTSGHGLTWDGTTATPIPDGPPARAGFGLAYDRDRARTVLCGGGDITTPMTDTWEWDGASWSLRTSIAPALLQPANETFFDSARHRIVACAGPSNVAYDWDGTVWTQIGISGASLPHGNFSVVADPAHARVLMYGGNTLGGSDTSDIAAGQSAQPVFVLQPNPVYAVEGSTVTFACQCASPAQGYQWRKNGTPIPGATSLAYTIPASSTSDSGTYDVVATGFCNTTVASSTANLTVFCYANCDHSTTSPVLNVADFTCFLQKFAAGCH